MVYQLSKSGEVAQRLIVGEIRDHIRSLINCMHNIKTTSLNDEDVEQRMNLIMDNYKLSNKEREQLRDLLRKK